jgi:hypothetical protein
LAIFLATAGVITTQHRDFYFSRPVEAWGDFAANNLAIRNAGEGRELYGNYSRWRLNHPGPAVFYVEAAGERLFYKWLSICPRPHNAHALAGMLLQVFFWSLSLSILAAYLPRLGHVAAVWALSWIHLNATEHAFASIWPPHTLLMPFVCYSLACVSTATGRLTHLWIVPTAGLTLIHNHVAQPLPVVLMACWVVVALYFNYRRGWPLEFPTKASRKYWIALCLVPSIVLLAPLVIDLFQGADSNLNAILAHLQRHEEGKSLGVSIRFFLEFGRYWGYHDVIGADFKSESSKLIIPVAIWGCITLGVIAHILSVTRKQPLDSYAKFLRSLMIGGTVLLAAALLWGTRITGPMYAFNGFYFYGIYLLPVIAFACAFYDRVLGKSRVRRELVWIGAAIVPWVVSRYPILSDINAGNELKVRLESYIAEGRLSLAQPILLLPSADVGLEAASVANLLEDKGGKIVVSPSWLFLFGKRFDVRHQRAGSRPAVWAVTTSNVKSAEPSLDLGGAENTKLIHVDVKWNGKHLYETKFEPDFLPLMAGFAIDGTNPPWSFGSEGDIVLTSAPAASDVEVTLDLRALAGPKNSDPRRVRIRRTRGTSIQYAISDRQSINWKIPQEEWNAEVEEFGFVIFHFEFLDPISPAECGINDDDRKLSLAFEKLTLRLVKN